MHISLARLASFCHSGFISDPLIVSKFHNETHDNKGQENKIPVKNGGFLFLCSKPNQSATTKCVFSVLIYSYQSPTLKGVFLYFSLIVTKTIRKRVFYLYFCPYSDEAIQKQVFSSSIFAFILIKALPKMVFFSILTYSNQSFTKKDDFSSFALTTTKALPKRVFFLYFCPYSFKSLPKRVFFLYYCPYSN